MAETSIGVLPLHYNLLVLIYDTGANVLSFGDKQFYVMEDFKLDKETMKRYDVQNHSHPGIRPRWAKVLAVCEGAEDVGVKIGSKVLLEQLEWSRPIIYNESRQKCWKIPLEKVLLVDNEGFNEKELELIEYAEKNPDVFTVQRTQQMYS